MKHIIFDVDGVVIQGKLFAAEVAIQKFGLNQALIKIFFTQKWKECVEGRSCLKELLSYELPKWGFRGSVEEYMEFWFQTESSLDKEVLELVSELKKKGIRCHLGSNQEKFRANFLCEILGLKNYFEMSFFSGLMGVSKPSEQFYQIVQNTLQASATEIMLIDDRVENIEGAMKAGWKTLLWPVEKDIKIV